MTPEERLQFAQWVQRELAALDADVELTLAHLSDPSKTFTEREILKELEPSE